MARDQNESGIIGQVLNGPVMCHPKYFPADKYEYSSWEQNKNASILSKAQMLKCWKVYYPNTGPDVYANPLLVNTVEGLPSACKTAALVLKSSRSNLTGHSNSDNRYGPSSR
jgi:hypothetical protein